MCHGLLPPPCGVYPGLSQEHSANSLIFSPPSCRVNHLSPRSHHTCYWRCCNLQNIVQNRLLKCYKRSCRLCSSELQYVASVPSFNQRTNPTQVHLYIMFEISQPGQYRCTLTWLRCVGRQCHVCFSHYHRYRKSIIKINIDM